MASSILMKEEQWTWSKEQRIPSDTAIGRHVVEELVAQLEQNDWQEDDIFGVNLSVEEALVNAIKHGNQESADKSVEVDLKVSPVCVRIEIADEGNGFNPAEVADPTDDDNLEVPSGRGLMLMRTFMTVVEYSEKGTRVMMEKRIT